MKGNKKMVNLTLEEKVAKALFDVKAVKINVGEPFTFASGIKSPIYCDNRYVLGFSDERDTIVESFVERIDKDVDVIVGVATAGIPWASFIADSVKKVTQFKLDYYDPEANDVMGYIEGLETRKQINDAISELPAKCREVFILSYQHDKKNKEIAEQLGISIRTVEVHLYKALKTLRTRLKRHT